MVSKLIITSGEPAGVGPEIVLELAQQNWPMELVVCVDKAMLIERSELLNKDITFIDYDKNTIAVAQKKGTITVLDLALPSESIPGELNVTNAKYVLDMLSRATTGCLDDEFQAVVTAPIHKGIINDSGIKFSGHTEFFAQGANSELVVMMLATKGLRVALVTTHLPLFEVPKAITPELLTQVITILHDELQVKYGIENPKIYVCGLNPHAGEGGHMGREEIEVIEPTLNALRDKKIDLKGPFPADTLFQEKYLDDADAVLAMYHDQGLPVLKYKGFGSAVNITLGLPFIRTSVDHGTALDLAGTGKASSKSLFCAVNEAIRMIESKKSKTL